MALIPEPCHFSKDSLFLLLKMVLLIETKIWTLDVFIHWGIIVFRLGSADKASMYICVYISLCIYTCL